MTVSSQSVWLLNLVSKPYPCFRSYYAGTKCCSAYLFLLHPSHSINNFILLMIWGVVHLGKPPLGPWGLSCSQVLTGASIIRKPYGADGNYPLKPLSLLTKTPTGGFSMWLGLLLAWWQSSNLVCINLLFFVNFLLSQLRAIIIPRKN